MAAGPVSRRTFIGSGMAAAVWPLLPASAQPRDLAALTLKKASDLVRRREVSAVELTDACLARIDAFNPLLNAFVTVAREQALEAARRLDAERRRNRWRGPLHGIPVALKDNIDTAGIGTTGGSALFKDRVPDGLPAISVPCGFTVSGLPIGPQFAGAPFAEGTVCAAAHAYEQATGWHRRRPTLPTVGSGK